LGEAKFLTASIQADAGIQAQQAQQAAQLKQQQQQRDALNQNQAMWLASMPQSALMANGASGGNTGASLPASMRSAALPASEPFVPSEVDQTKEIINGAYAEGQGIISQALAAGGGGAPTAMPNNTVPAPQITAMTSPPPSMPSVAPANGVPASGTEEISHPLRGVGTKTSGFGNRTHPVTGQHKHHNGTDFAAPAGTPIFPAWPGTVSYKGEKGGYGNTIIIDHPNGMQTLYAHMLKPSPLQKDQVVAQGTQIGEVGSTGLSTGNHLHFEIKKHDGEKYVAVDPVNYLGQNASKEKGTQVAQAPAKSKGKSKST
jgi:murein DD-endopeptidase MepM/ murein hydrolase activator NlpD